MLNGLRGLVCRFLPVENIIPRQCRERTEVRKHKDRKDPMKLKIG